MSCPEEINALEAFWHAKRDGRALPSRCDFTPHDLRPWLGNIAIIVVERSPGITRFRVALSGTQLDDYRGHSVTGQYIDELHYNRAGNKYYEACLAARAPVRFLHDNSSNSAVYANMAKLLLPLSEDGVTIDRILAAIYPLSANDQAAARSCYALAG